MAYSRPYYEDEITEVAEGLIFVEHTSHLVKTVLVDRKTRKALAICTVELLESVGVGQVHGLEKSRLVKAETLYGSFQNRLERAVIERMPQGMRVTLIGKVNQRVWDGPMHRFSGFRDTYDREQSPVGELVIIHKELKDE